ncbi:hypothetical protein [Flavivirga sp. 57AJ16]|uniref:hypothetical protein n=1 Tax=Flavivirga sp. 57AJ16 TaxID=3025307 RepID=UPI0023652027|nr:hypothetical protein [Flavivirga sp. 57AJ16]MDD7885849.1 hypothetical protein [Flavivirga sp. 57AJ16]
MKIIANLLIFIHKIVTQPLSLLRFSLSILVGKQLYEALKALFKLTNNTQYSLSKTWFLNMLPDSLFIFDTELFITLKYIIIVSTIGAALGLLGRLNLLIVSFLSFFLFGTVEGMGVFNHALSLPSQIILVLALVPGSMKISLDYFILNFKHNYKQKFKVLSFSENPKWGINLVLLLVMLTYLTAGISKLRYGNGINWLDGSTLSFYLKERTNNYKAGGVQLIIGDNKITDQDKWKDKFGFIGHTYSNTQTSKTWNKIADYIGSNKLLSILLSIGSILFEVLGFIMFINSKYRNIYLISAILFHLSINLLMGISFTEYQLICFCLIDWGIIIGYFVRKLNFSQKGLATI